MHKKINGSKIKLRRRIVKMDNNYNPIEASQQTTPTPTPSGASQEPVQAQNMPPQYATQPQMPPQYATQPQMPPQYATQPQMRCSLICRRMADRYIRISTSV